MKLLLLLVSTAIAFSANARTLNEAEVLAAVAANKFNCEDDAPFRLKKFYGDTLNGAVKSPLFFPQRKNYDSIDCSLALLTLYKDGRPEFFKLVDQIESIQSAEKLVSLPGYATKFDEDNRLKAKNALSKLGVNFTTPNALVQIALVDVNQVGSNSRMFILNLHAARASADKISILDFDSLTGEKISLVTEAMRLEVLVRNMDSADLKLAAKQLADIMVDKISILEAYMAAERRRYDPAKLTWFQLLHLTGRSQLRDKLQYSPSEQTPEVLAILAIEDPAIKAKEIEQLVSRMANYAYFSDRAACSIVLGEILLAKDQATRQRLVKISNGLQCRTQEFYSKGAKLTDKSTGDSKTFAAGEIGDVNVIMAEAAKTCSMSESLKDLLNLEVFKYTYSALSQFDVAVNKGCKEVAVFWGNRAFEFGNVINEVTQHLSKADPKFRAAVFKEILPRLKDLNDAQIENIREKIGPAAARLAKISRNGAPSRANEILFAAAEQDTDDTISLQWNETKIDIDANRVNSTQQKFIDAIRSNPSDVMLPLTQAFVGIQAENRGIYGNELNSYDRSVADFLAQRTSGVPESLAAAKILLDGTLARVGGNNNYNLASTSIFDVLLKGRAQCASGTDFMLVHTARSSGFSVGDKVAVAIMKPGHVLPGFADKKMNSVEGIESTVDGKAQVIISLTNKTLPDNMRVILADDYLMTKVLASALKDSAATQNALMARAEKVLGFKQGKIIEDKTPMAADGTQPTSDGLNNSIFAFGRANVPSGDLPRAHMDAVPADVDGAKLAELGRPRPPSQGQGLSRFPLASDGQADKGSVMVRMRTPLEMLGILDPRVFPRKHLMMALEREHVNLPVIDALDSVPQLMAELLASIAQSKGVVVQSEEMPYGQNPKTYGYGRENRYGKKMARNSPESMAQEEMKRMLYPELDESLNHFLRNNSWVSEFPLATRISKDVSMSTRDDGVKRWQHDISRESDSQMVTEVRLIFDPGSGYNAAVVTVTFQKNGQWIWTRIQTEMLKPNY